jgi:DNA-binding SARP family transcriptional activator
MASGTAVSDLGGCGPQCWANDGIVSTASLLVGVAAANASPGRGDHRQVGRTGCRGDVDGDTQPDGAVKARLRVLGPPGIDDVTAPGPELRAKGLELAVFLACHPDGMSTRDLAEHLAPDAHVNQADQRIHTYVSNLRKVFGRAAGLRKNAYVIRTANRCHRERATVHVDVWQLRDVLKAATTASGPRRRELLRDACDLYGGPLADGHDYEWIQPHREAVRRWAVEAHLVLADELLDDDPQAASDLLDTAISLNPHHEPTYVKAMHARHALGDADGIRILERALAKAFADLDAEPSEDTIALATRLRTDLTR